MASEDDGPNMIAVGVTRGDETARAAIEATCANHGLTLTRIYDCEAELQDAIEAACASRAVLVAESLSCVADCILDVVRLGIRLKDAGAQWLLLEPELGPLTSPAMLDLLASMGNLEFHRLGDRLPYGYTVADDLEHIVISPSESAVIRRILDWHYQDIALDDIAERLNAEAIPARSSQSWTSATVGEVVDGAVTSRWDGLA